MGRIESGGIPRRRTVEEIMDDRNKQLTDAHRAMTELPLSPDGIPALAEVLKDAYEAGRDTHWINALLSMGISQARIVEAYGRMENPSLIPDQPQKKDAQQSLEDLFETPMSPYEQWKGVGRDLVVKQSAEMEVLGAKAMQLTGLVDSGVPLEADALSIKEQSVAVSEQAFRLGVTQGLIEIYAAGSDLVVQGAVDVPAVIAVFQERDAQIARKKEQTDPN